MRRISSFILAAVALMGCSAAHGQGQPSTWKYQMVNGVSTATYPGVVYAGQNGQVLPAAATNAALTAMPSTLRAVVRTGYYVAGDTAPLEYQASASACTISAGAGDGGSQVPTSDGKCWIASWPSAGIDVKQYGAKCDGATNDQPRIQAAVNYLTETGVNRITFPGGVCRINAEILIQRDSATLEGSGLSGTTIEQTTLNAKIFNVPWSNIKISNFRLEYVGGTPVSGATAIYNSGGNNIYTQIYIDRVYNGFEFTGGTSNFLSQFQIFHYENIGVHIRATNDIFIDQFVINANGSPGALGGFRLQDRAEAVTISNGDVLGGQHSVTMAATSNTVNNRPAYSKFTNFYADSSTDEGMLIDSASNIDFVNCWVSGGRTQAKAGVAIANSQAIRFTASTFFNNGLYGALVQSTAKQISFVNSQFVQNMVTASGTGAGLYFAAGATDFTATGNLASNTGYPNTQAYGIQVAAGASDRYQISNNLVTGNATGGVLDGGAGANKSVTANY